MSDWNPDKYLRYGSERTQPSIDLVSRIRVTEPKNIMDLGCGPGNSTLVLKKRWPKATITGLDSSPQMIKQAKADYPKGDWVLGDIASWSTDQQYDVIFSSATLQWIPNHEPLFLRLMTCLKDAGVLAIQLPYHYDSPLHRSIIEVSKDARWTRHMDSARNALTYKSASFYYDVLSSNSSELSIWTTEYFHVLDSPQAILDWISVTGLRPFFSALDSDEEVDRFKQLLLEKYTAVYARQKNGNVIFPFKRQFILARK